MQVGGIRVNRYLAGIQVACKSCRFGRTGVAHGSNAFSNVLRFLDCFLRPRTGDEVICRRFIVSGGRQQVHRQLCELLGRSTLQEEHPVIGRNAHQFTKVGLGRLNDGRELLAAMAHLHYAATGAVPVEQFVLDLLQHFGRQNGRARSEIPDA